MFSEELEKCETTKLISVSSLDVFIRIYFRWELTVTGYCSTRFDDNFQSVHDMNLDWMHICSAGDFPLIFISNEKICMHKHAASSYNTGQKKREDIASDQGCAR